MGALLTGCPVEEPIVPPDEAGAAEADVDASMGGPDVLIDVAAEARSDGAVDAGPPPTTSCTITKDSNGFFTRTSSEGSYVAYVPASYNGEPMRVIVGLHGCGDNAYNFATWGVNPYATRSTQNHIGLSIGGRDGTCWNTSGDDDAKVMAAVEDIATCFYVHQRKVVLAGFSSGGDLTFRVGLRNASSFAGLLIEDSSLYGTGDGPALLSAAAWKLPMAHRHHTSDPVYPIVQVRADWLLIKAAGFPLVTSETAGGHDGVTEDWADWLIPQSRNWTSP
jgi:poly(3-hydroxybutyrate) depolymerase